MKGTETSSAIGTEDKSAHDAAIVADVCARHNLHPDQDLFWLWCGTEAKANLLGPWEDRKGAEWEAQDARGSGYCKHDHIVVRMTTNQLLRHRIPWENVWSSNFAADLGEALSPAASGRGPEGSRVSVAF